MSIPKLKIKIYFKDQINQLDLCDVYLTYVFSKSYLNNISHGFIIVKHSGNQNPPSHNVNYNEILRIIIGCFDDLEIIKYLLHKGANMYYKDKYGCDILCYLNKSSSITSYITQKYNKKYTNYLKQYFCSDLAKFITKFC